MYDRYSVFPENDFFSFKKHIFEKENLDFERHELKVNEAFHFMIFSGKDSYHDTNFRALLGDEINKLDDFFEKYVDKTSLYLDGRLIPVNEDFVYKYYETGRNDRGMLLPDIVLVNNEFYLRLDLWSNRFLTSIENYEVDELFKEISRSLIKVEYGSISIDLIINYKNLGRKKLREDLIRKIESGCLGASDILYVSRILYYVYNDFKYSYKCLLLAYSLNIRNDYLIYRIASEFLLMFNEIQISLSVSLTNGKRSYCYRKLWFVYYSRLINGISNKEDLESDRDKYRFNYFEHNIPFPVLEKLNIDNWKEIEYTFTGGVTIERDNQGNLNGIFSLDQFILDKSLIDYYLLKLNYNYSWNNGFGLRSKNYFNSNTGINDYEKTNIKEKLSIIHKQYIYDMAFSLFKNKNEIDADSALFEKIKSELANKHSSLPFVIHLIKKSFIKFRESTENIDINDYMKRVIIDTLPKEGYQCKNSIDYHYLKSIIRDSDIKIKKPNNLESVPDLLRLYCKDDTKSESKKLIDNRIKSAKEDKASYRLKNYYRFIIIAILLGDNEYAKHLSSILYKTIILEERTRNPNVYYKLLYIENKLNGTYVTDQIDKLYPQYEDRFINYFNKMSLQIDTKKEIEAIKTLDMLRAEFGHSIVSNQYNEPKEGFYTYDKGDFSKYFYINRGTDIQYKKMTHPST